MPRLPDHALFALRCRRCNARLKSSRKTTGNLQNLFCRRWAAPGSKRCKLHGAKSTGPRSPAGKARSIAAMVEGRRRWLAGLKAAGMKAPCGRKPGPGAKVRAREAERRAALTTAERFVEDHNAALAAGLNALDGLRARLAGAARKI
jgi:hypothetical protein